MVVIVHGGVVGVVCGGDGIDAVFRVNGDSVLVVVGCGVCGWLHSRYQHSGRAGGCGQGHSREERGREGEKEWKCERGREST